MRRSVSKVLCMPALIISLAGAGCATTGTDLTSAAERLERRADDLSDERGASRYSRDAEEFAREARDFRGTLGDRDTDDADIEDAFRDLSERYHALRDEVDRSDDRNVEEVFQGVTEAYLDVEREMRTTRTRYARD